MSNNIQGLFNTYKTKYPFYNKDQIVEIMLDDGVITFEIAKKNQIGY